MAATLGVRQGIQLNAIPGTSPIDQLRIALCPPEFYPLIALINGRSMDATYIIQNYIASGLKSRGHEVTYFAPRDVHEIVCTKELTQLNLAQRTWTASPWFDATSRASWKIQQFLGLPYLNFFSNYRLYDACMQCLPGNDLVYERNSLYKCGVAMACKRLDIPYVLYYEADDIMEHDFMGKPITGLLRRRAIATARYNLETADCVICVSEPGKSHLVENWGIPANKVVVFPNAVDIHRFHPDPGARADVRKSLGVKTELLILFVGSFYKWHDVTTLLKAFSQVLLTHPQARLILAGEGEQHQAMVQLTAELGITSNVRFTGRAPHEDVPGLMAAADIAVVPYPPMDHELWLSPLKLFEYLASGVAVIASKSGQLADVIHDGRNGLLVTPGDTEAMAAALNQLIENPTLRSRLGWNARENAVQYHSWEGYIARLERLFSAVIASEPAGFGNLNLSMGYE